MILKSLALLLVANITFVCSAFLSAQQLPEISLIKRFSPDEKEIVLDRIRIEHNNQVSIRGQSQHKYFWYSCNLKSERFTKHELPQHLSGLIVDYTRQNGELHLLCKKSMWDYQILSYDSADPTRHDLPVNSVQLSLNYVPNQLYVHADGSFILATVADTRSTERYHFHKYSQKGDLVTGFAPVIALPDSVPLFSLYYFAATDGQHGSGYVVTYWFLPLVRVFDPRGEEVRSYNLSLPEPISSYSFDPDIQFGMRIPKQRLLGRATFDASGRIWAPIIWQNNKDVYTEIRVFNGPDLDGQYKVAEVKILGLQVSDDATSIYAHTRDEFLIFQLESKNRNGQMD